MDEREIFEEALDLTEPHRGQFVRDRCDGDDELAGRIRRLLAAHEHADQVTISMPPIPDAPVPPAPPTPSAPSTPESIGTYRILNRLGEGGMGIVFLAEQTRPVKRHVAIKVLKSGLSSHGVVARFYAERQALAIMDHPCVATVYDAGETEDGHPYFVMEYVRGKPITQYCSQTQLTTERRLLLFEQVCQAVQHAHQKGVIHRDLKPNNILVSLVDDRPVPKIIDFGIAKAAGAQLTEETIDTLDHHVLGTPEYMSPEQATLGQADIDTRTDIYSLGVVLYVLLTGESPYDIKRMRGASYRDIERIICEEEPPRPSQRLQGMPARRRLSEDLDWVVMRAIAKDRNHRYPTAFALAADVRRFLDHEPVEAGPLSRRYKLKKFYARHRRLVVSSGMVAAALVVATVVSLFFANSAINAHNESQQRLWDSYLAQARSARASPMPGRRQTALSAIAAAAAIRPEPVLRDEAIAAMAVFDIDFRRSFVSKAHVSAAGLRTTDRLLLTDSSGEIQIRSIIGDQELMRLQGPAIPVEYSFFSPGGEYVAVGRQSTDRTSMIVWDLATQSPVIILDLDPVRSGIAFDAGPVTRWIAIAEYQGPVHVYDLPGGDERFRIEVEESWAQVDGDPSGQMLAVGRYFAQVVDIWDVQREELITTLDVPCRVMGLAWHHDGQTIAVEGEDGKVYIFDRQTGSIQLRLIGHQAQVVEAEWVTALNVLVTGAWDGTIRVWDADNGQEVLGPITGVVRGVGNRLVMRDRDDVSIGSFGSFGVYHRVQSPAAIAMLGEGRFCVSWGKEGIGVMNLGPEHEWPRSLPTNEIVDDKPVKRLHVLPDDSGVIALYDQQEVVLWRCSFEKDADRPALHRERTLWSGPCKKTGIDPSGRWLLVITSTDEINIVNIETGEVTFASQAYRGVLAGSIHPGGGYAFTGTWQGEPGQIWDLRTGETIGSFEGSVEYGGAHVTGVFSPSGDRLIVTDGQHYYLLRAPDWSEVGVFRRANRGNLASDIAFTPDGSVAAIVDAVGTVVLIHARTGHRLAILTTPNRRLATSLSFSHDGRYLICGTPGNVTEIWDITLLRERLQAMNLDWDD